NEYIVAINRDGRTRRLIWDSRYPIALDHPAHHVLEQSDGVIQIRNKADNEIIGYVPPEFVQEGTLFQALDLDIEIREVNRPRAAFLPTTTRQHAGGAVGAGAG